MTRREFLRTGTSSAVCLTLAPQLVKGAGNPQPMPTSTSRRPIFVSTWPFGKPSNEAALQAVARGASMLDAVEQGIQLAESDPTNSSVGMAGIPNAGGIVQLDACIMSGPGHRAGSVAALEGIAHPISVARRVMEKTPHVMLVGAGAREFALKEGFPSVPMVSPQQKAAWEKWKADQEAKQSKNGKNPKNHDTIALVGLGPDGHLYGGCSTSGWGYKLPGRVGDSPILGGGLYLDDDVGAAGATGLGENVMRYCGSYQVVEFMRQGMKPEQACLEVIRRIAKIDPKGFDLSINFIALNKEGEFGAAGTGQGFQYSVTYPDYSAVLQSPGLSTAHVGPVGGNIK